MLQIYKLFRILSSNMPYNIKILQIAQKNETNQFGLISF